MKKKFLGIILSGCLMLLPSLSIMAAEQEYIIDFCDEVKNSYTSEELAAISEEINKDNAIAFAFNDEVLSKYTPEEIAEIEKNVRQDVNDYLKEESYVKYIVKAEHDCYPTGPYADIYGGKNSIYNSQGNLIMYLQLGVCKYPSSCGCTRLVYKYTYV